MTSSDEAGVFELELPAGTYALRCVTPGYGVAAVEDLRVEIDPDGASLAFQNCDLSDADFDDNHFTGRISPRAP